MSTAPLIDMDTIETLRELNPDDNGEFLREIIGIFLEDTPQRIAELEEALQSGDRNKFIRAAHSVKGSSANMGALALRETAEELEHKAKDAALCDLSGLIATLKADFGQTQVEIEKIKT